MKYSKMPWAREYILFADFPFQMVQELGEVWVHVSWDTKTRLYINLETPAPHKEGVTTPGKTFIRMGINYIPAASQDFKFHINNELSMVSGEKRVRSYFKITKKQGLVQLERHLLNCMEDIFGKFGIKQLNVHVLLTPCVLELGATENRVVGQSEELV